MENNIYRLNWCHFNWLEWCLSPHYFARLPEGKVTSVPEIFFNSYFGGDLFSYAFRSDKNGPKKQN